MRPTVERAADVGCHTTHRRGESPADGGLQTLKQLGEGSSAIVSLAAHTKPWLNGGRQLMAMKKMRMELLRHPEEVAAFVAEVKLLRRLHHRYIVEFYGCGWSAEAPDAEDDQPRAAHQLYCLQEYMAGGSLHSLVLKAMSSPAPRKVYSDADALRWALQLAQALEYLHKRTPKVIHRDLKLENVLLSSDRAAEADAKLADFGLARKMESGRQTPGTAVSSMGLPSSFVRTGSDELENRLAAVCAPQPAACPSAGAQQDRQHMTACTGSLGYIAPEVLTGAPYNDSADVFSFGVLIYNLFHRDIPTFRILVQGGFQDLQLWARNVANGFRPRLSLKVPAGVRALIERCWSGQPELRPSMGEVAAELERLQAAALSHAGRSAPAQRPKAARQDGGRRAKGPCCAVM